jgi:hypothetical protein
MAGGDDRAKPVSLFYSYSHQDERLRVKLQRALVVLRRNGLIAEWHDRNIDAGDDWAKAIDRNLATADIILLLVSADFLASDYCWGEEMTKSLQRHERRETRVIPVILRPCRWMETPLKDMQAVPTNAKPVTPWANEDEAFDDVAAKITRVVREIHKQRSAVKASAPERPHPSLSRPRQREGPAAKTPGGRGNTGTWRCSATWMRFGVRRWW